MSNKREFGEVLKELRKELGLSQDVLEIRTGIDRTTISAYENGTRDPSYKNLNILADLFKVSLDYLAGRSNQKLDKIYDDKSEFEEKKIYTQLVKKDWK